MGNWSESEAIGMGIGEYSMKKVTKYDYYFSLYSSPFASIVAVNILYLLSISTAWGIT
jgi:hypothetical protein